MTGYSQSCRSTKLIHWGAPKRNVLSDKIVLGVAIHIFYFMLYYSSLLSTVISFVYKDKWWFNEGVSVIFYMDSTEKIVLFSVHANKMQPKRE